VDSCTNAACFFPPVDCNDGSPCTTDSCDNGNCVHTPVPNCNLNISGTIVSELGAGIRSVTVKLTGSGNQTFTTGTSGIYNFDVAQGGSFTVTPSKSNDTITNNGVSTLDIILIQKMVLAIQPLSTPYKIIAADVNNSRTVTTLDIILIRSVILQVNLTFPNGRLWAFVSSDFNFANPLSPFPYDNYRSYTNISSNQINQDFIGVKLGDVNNSWNPNVAKMGTVGEVHFRMDEYHVMPADEIIVPVRVKDFSNITGYQFTLSWNPGVLSFMGINDNALSGFYGESRVSEGYLTTSWNLETTEPLTLDDDAVAFELKFKVIGKEGDVSPVRVSSDITPQEAYNENLDLLDITAANGIVKVGDAAVFSHLQTKDYHLSVVPNPFTNNTNLVFSLPRQEQVSIVIYDLLGKEVWHVLGNFDAGDYSLEWTGDDDNGKPLSPGLYHVRMLAGEQSLSSKSLLVK